MNSTQNSALGSINQEWKQKHIYLFYLFTVSEKAPEWDKEEKVHRLLGKNQISAFGS